MNILRIIHSHPIDKKRGGRLTHTLSTLVLVVGIVYVSTSPALDVVERFDRLSQGDGGAVVESVATLMPAVVVEPSSVRTAEAAPRALTVEEFSASAFTPLDGVVTSGVGERLDPFGSGEVEVHRGVDIAVVDDYAVRAADDGMVVVSEFNNGYGNYIVIEHDGGIETLYAHLEYAYVNVGDAVTRGMLIGKAGATGRATGVHLHFEIRN